MPVIALPDGSSRQFDKAITVYDVAADIGVGLAKATLAGIVDGREVDASYSIENDAERARKVRPLAWSHRRRRRACALSRLI